MRHPERRPPRRRKKGEEARTAPLAPLARGVRPRRAGPQELFAEVAPLLAGGPKGEDAFSRLAELLQDDPALIDLRLDGLAVADAVAAAAPAGLPALDETARARLVSRSLPALVPPRFGRQAAETLAAVMARRSAPGDRQALALARYFAILDDVEGAAGAGTNPLWHLLFELTWAEQLPSEAEERELLDLPEPGLLAVAASQPPPARLEPSLGAAYQKALDRASERPAEEPGAPRPQLRRAEGTT